MTTSIPCAELRLDASDVYHLRLPAHHAVSKTLRAEIARVAEKYVSILVAEEILAPRVAGGYLTELREELIRPSPRSGGENWEPDMILTIKTELVAMDPRYKQRCAEATDAAAKGSSLEGHPDSKAEMVKAGWETVDKVPRMQPKTCGAWICDDDDCCLDTTDDVPEWAILPPAPASPSPPPVSVDEWYEDILRLLPVAGGSSSQRGD